MTEIDWPRVQHRLGVPDDGAAGPLTYGALLAHVAGRSLGQAGALLAHSLAVNAGGYQLTTPLRLAHFLGQTCVESGGYRFLREIWGPTETQLGYETRRDLGNRQPGDGRRYLGRGLIQITGRDAYRTAGARLRLDLEGEPQLAERPDIAVLTALDWWQAHNCNPLADCDDAVGLSRLINRGSAHATRPANHEADRLASTAHAKGLLA